MNRNFLNSLTVIGLSLCSLMVIAPQHAIASWKYNNNGYWYTEENSWTIGWKYIYGLWYYFDSDGYMKTSSWIKTDGKWYYVSSNGSMLESTTVDGYLIGSDGAWIDDTPGWKQSNTGKWWYLDENGDYATYWKSFDTNEYEIDQYGQGSQMKTWYYFGYDGYMKTGWHKINGKWYYFKESGEMAVDENIGGYILGKDGAMIDDLFVKKDDGDFVLKILNPSMILSDKKVELCIINNTGKVITEYWHPYEPGPYSLEEYIDGQWKTLSFNSPYDGMEEFAQYINCVDIKTINIQTIDLSEYKEFNESKPGKYRLLFYHSYENEKSYTAYAEFEINPEKGSN